MESHGQENLLAKLKSGQPALLAALSGVTGQAAATSPAPGKWSVLRSVERLAASEDRLFSQIAASHDSPATVANKDRETRVRTVGLDRTWSAQSPEVARPARRFSPFDNGRAYPPTLAAGRGDQNGALESAR